MTILDEIVETRKERLKIKKGEIAESDLVRRIDPPRLFFQKDGITVIAECKRGSPSKGVFVKDYNPVSIACDYERGGAHAISVLTEPDYFYGDETHLKNVRQVVSIPVLRKDFIVDTYQVRESWALGADAVLLIAAVLSESQMKELADCAAEYDLEVLLEVHNKEELEKAILIPAAGIGINARNLKDFSIDMELSRELCGQIPVERIAVAESGMMSPEDGKVMFNAGFRGFLVGEYFITANDREKNVRNFVDFLGKER